MKQYKTTTNSNRYEKFELFKWLGLTCLNSNINIHHWIDSVHMWIEERFNKTKKKRQIKTLNMIVRWSAFSLSVLADIILNVVTFKWWLWLLCLAEHLSWQLLPTSFAGCNHAFTFLVGTKGFQSPTNRRIFADVIVFPINIWVDP